MVYSEEYRIKSYEVDLQKRYKPFSFMNKAQETAHGHSSLAKFGYADLIKMNYVWVISRAHVKFLDAPQWEDKVTMKTWSKQLDGLFAIRDFELVDELDNKLIIATTSWLLMDLESRRLKRIDHVFTGDVSAFNDERSAIDEHCSKIKSEKDLEFVWNKVIRTSDLDYNMHANNAKYIEWSFDTLDFDFVRNALVDEFRISFNHEAKIGDSIDMYRKQISDNEYYIEGKMAETSVFQMVLKFK